MILDEARNIISNFHKLPPSRMIAALYNARSEAERRRLEQTQADLEKVRVAHNEAISHAERCITIVNEIVHLLWYNGLVPDPEKAADIQYDTFFDDVSTILTNYGYCPGKPSVLDES